MERFYAKGGRIQGIDGKVQSRDADIAIFATGKIRPKFIDHGPLNIATYGHYGEMFSRFSDVLVKRDGRWQLIIQQGGPAPPDFEVAVSHPSRGLLTSAGRAIEIVRLRPGLPP